MMEQNQAVKSREDYLDILSSNRGFEDPSLWIDYARENGFEKVPARQLSACPDCASRGFKRIGQYLYYSNLIRLNECGHCSLVYSDVILNEKTLRNHFDAAYKDEHYFENRRRAVYRQITGLIKKKAPRNSTVLDVGGAKGHLGRVIRHERPDLQITINDLSAVACEYARTRFLFDTVCSSMSDLAAGGGKYDFVLLIDVLYYEHSIGRAWTAVTRLADKGIIMRIPNKYLLIRLVNSLRRILKRELEKKKMDTMAFFNPEHIYIFKRGYLTSRLRECGFETIRVVPSRPLESGNAFKRMFQGMFFRAAMLVYYATFRQLVLTPAQLLYAEKKRP